MNNAKIINIFNSDNSNIAYIKTKIRQTMAATASRILIKKPIVTNHEFFTSYILVCMHF